MTIEHANIQEAGLHEPKGVSLATTGQVYTANGAGSGVYQLPQIQGQSTAVSGSVPISNGAGGSVWTESFDVPVGRMNLINASIAVALTAGSVHTSGSYVDVTNSYVQSFTAGGLTFDATNHFVVQEAGIYRVTAWASVASSAGGNPTVGMDLNINGVAAGPGSAVVQWSSKGTSNLSTVTGMGVGSFSVGDVIGLSFACEANTTLTIYDSVVDIVRVRS